MQRRTGGPFFRLLASRSPIPANHNRYLDQEAVIAIRLYALREDDDSNYSTGRRYRTQFLGSVLLWTFRAGATQVVYNVNSDEPFVYTDSYGNSVQSEFPQPPKGLRDGMIDSLFVDTIDGHPIKRPIRRFVRRWFGCTAHGKLLVPDADNGTESEWSLVVDGQSATVSLLGTSPYAPSEKTKYPCDATEDGRSVFSSDCKSFSRPR